MVGNEIRKRLWSIMSENPTPMEFAASQTRPREGQLPDMKPLLQSWSEAFRDARRALLRRLGIATQHELRQMQQEVRSLDLQRQRHEQILQQYQQVLQQHQQVLQQHTQQSQQHEQRLIRGSESLRWIAEHLQSTKTLAPSQEGPLVSIVMPVWNRASTVSAAIESVLEQSYANWELLIVDDGSQDRTVEVVQEFTQDARIRLHTGPHIGVCRARNRALSEARGEVIAYLDSDNTWFPHYLGEVAREFQQHPKEDSVFAAQLVERANGTEWFIRAITFDHDRFLEEGGIDLNAFAHRRRLVEELGGFDEQLTRLVDWELAIRYTWHRAPKFLPVLSGRYAECRADSVSAKESFERNRELIRQRHPRKIPAAA
ncbi:MAG: glycosyl transferase family protein [Planctomycetota bacterium]|nr:MAG: glycosyl transferase family protein [Planctomycetota bacterium]